MVQANGRAENVSLLNLYRQQQNVLFAELSNHLWELRISCVDYMTSTINLIVDSSIQSEQW